MEYRKCVSTPKLLKKKPNLWILGDSSSAIVLSIPSETVVPAENHRPVESHWQTHNVVSSIPRHELKSLRWWFITKLASFVIITSLTNGTSWSYGTWIYNYLCNQCLSSLTLWVRIPLMTRYTRYNIMCLSVTFDRSVVFRGYYGFTHLFSVAAILY
jgi:hypothetical protein